jgi:hypothetical protein
MGQGPTPACRLTGRARACRLLPGPQPTATSHEGVGVLVNILFLFLFYFLFFLFFYWLSNMHVLCFISDWLHVYENRPTTSPPGPGSRLHLDKLTQKN